MRHIQETKAEIRRRGEERLAQIARNRRRMKAVCGGAALCCVMALVLTAAMTFTRTPVPLTSVAPHTTAASGTSTGNTNAGKPTSTTTAHPTTTLTEPTASTEAVFPMSTLPTTLPTMLPTTLPTIAPTTLPTTVPSTLPSTVPTTFPTTAPTSELPTTTTTKKPLFPLGSVTYFGAFKTPDLTVQEEAVFEVPFITDDSFYLTDGTIDIGYDPTLVAPIVRNDSDARNPYITAISEPIFAGGAIASSIVEEGVLRVHMERNGGPGDGQGGEMFRVTFRALAPTEESRMTIQVVELNGDDGKSDETLLAWGGWGGQLVISKKES